tara:strand:+ start:2467 stop:3069 length:603 start_codon:yes stop_codon:yes gene_type:complete
MSENKGRKRVRAKKKPGNSALAAKALIAMPDPTRVDVKDLIPETCKAKKGKDSLGRVKGGPHKYNQQTVEAILRNVAIGMPESRAAQLAGISAGTLSEWKKKWEDMREALARASAVAQDELYGVVRQGMSKNPRLALEVLERRFPGEWAAHSKHQVAGVMMQTQVSPEIMNNLHQLREARDQAGTDNESAVIDVEAKESE